MSNADPQITRKGEQRPRPETRRRSFHARPLTHSLPSLPIPGYQPERARASYTVWSGSTTDEVRFVPVSKKSARVWYQKARAWDRRTKERGRHGGGLGMPAMAVLHCFHFDFLNFASGRLDPSYEGIAKKTGLARSTVALAIAKLKRLGIINWARRCAHEYVCGTFTLRQRTNAYAILPPSQWRGFTEPVDDARPWPEATGATPPLPPLIVLAQAAECDGAPRSRQAWLLDADSGDSSTYGLLARTLAAFARSVDGQKE